MEELQRKSIGVKISLELSPNEFQPFLWLMSGNNQVYSISVWLILREDSAEIFLQKFAQGSKHINGVYM